MSHVYEWSWVRHGDLAVDFFFVLSGFVLTHAYGDGLTNNLDRLSFLIRRFGRLYPLHIATLGVVFLLEAIRWGAVEVLGRTLGRPVFSGDTDVASLGANIILIHAWGFFREFSWNIPSWSISVEWALCILFMLISYTRRVFISAAVLATAGFAVLVWMSQLPEFPFEGHSALARGIFGFFSGILIYRLFGRLHTQGIFPPGWLEWAAPLLLFGAVWAKTAQMDYLPTPIFALLVLIFAFQRGPVSRILRARPIMFLGEISYSIYLVHYVLVLAVFGFATALASQLDFQPVVERGPFGATLINMPNVWVGDMAAFGFLALVVAVAAFTYATIENPGRRFFNRLAKNIRPASPGTGVVP